MHLNGRDYGEKLRGIGRRKRNPTMMYENNFLYKRKKERMRGQGHAQSGGKQKAELAVPTFHL